jgi:hypothetical protein
MNAIYVEEGVSYTLILREAALPNLFAKGGAIQLLPPSRPRRTYRAGFLIAHYFVGVPI